MQAELRSCQVAGSVSVKSPPKTLLGEARGADVLPRYRSKTRRSRPHPQGQRIQNPSVPHALVPALPSPQQSLPSFSCLLSSLRVASDIMQCPSTDAARQECGLPHGTTAGLVAGPDSAVQSRVSQDSGIVAGISRSSRMGIVPSLGSTETGATAVDARSFSLIEGGFSQRKTTLSRIGTEVLKIARVVSARSRSHPTFAVQLLDYASAPRSKASQIQIYTIKSRTGPRLFGSIMTSVTLTDFHLYPTLVAVAELQVTLLATDSEARSHVDTGTITLVFTFRLQGKAN